MSSKRYVDFTNGKSSGQELEFRGGQHLSRVIASDARIAVFHELVKSFEAWAKALNDAAGSELVDTKRSKTKEHKDILTIKMKGEATPKLIALSGTVRPATLNKFCQMLPQLIKDCESKEDYKAIADKDSVVLAKNEFENVLQSAKSLTVHVEPRLKG